MLKINIRLQLVLLLVFQNIFAQYTDQINSNRPGESMSAFSVGKTVVQVESGIYGIQQNHDIIGYESAGVGLEASLRWGLFFEKLEFVADLQFQADQYTLGSSVTGRSGLRSTIFGAKYLLFDPFKNYKREVNLHSWKKNHSFDTHQLIPAISVFAGANLVFSNNPYAFSPEGSISPKIMLITQNHFGNGSWVFVTNIIADYISTDFPSFGYVLTLTKGFNEHWSGFIENQGYKSDFYSDALVRGGAAFLINKNMQVDASITTNFKNTPSVFYGGVGISWRFTDNYKEIKLQPKKDKIQSKAEKKAAKIKKG